MKNMLPIGYAGKLGYASAARIADFIVVNMVAEAASRLEDAEGSGGAGAEAGRALLQGLISRRAVRRRHDAPSRDAISARVEAAPATPLNARHAAISRRDVRSSRS